MLKADNGFLRKSAYPMHYNRIKGTSPIDCWYGLYGSRQSAYGDPEVAHPRTKIGEEPPPPRDGYNAMDRLISWEIHYWPLKVSDNNAMHCSGPSGRLVS